SPLIEVTEFEKWDQVKEWARKVFDIHSFDKSLIAKKAAEIAEQYPDKKMQLVAALRFVQDQVRYYGIEIGVNAIKPHTPDFTLRNRFGDCKDKSLLLCTLLN